MINIEKPFDLPKTAVVLSCFGFAEAAVLVLYCWLRWGEQHRLALKTLGSPYDNPRERLISALQSVKDIVIRPMLLMPASLTYPKGEELSLEGQTMWIRPDGLAEELVSFVHECWHMLLKRNGLWIRAHHDEMLIEDHSKIVVSLFKVIVLEELVYACGEYQLWFDGFAKEMCSFHFHPNHPWEKWFYNRTQHFLSNLDGPLEFRHMVRRKNTKSS